MDLLVSKLIENIENEENIQNREELVDFISSNLKKRIYFFNADDAGLFYLVIKSIDFDVNKISKLLDATYWVRNAITKQDKYRTRPTVKYLVTLKHVFDSLGIDINEYNSKHRAANIALSKCLYTMEMDNGFVNNERNILEITNTILDRYSSKEERANDFTKIITIINRINKGFRELESEYKNVVNSEEFYSLFEATDKLMCVYFSDIIKEFYPIFNNQLFVHIKNMANSNTESLETEDIIKYLRNIENSQYAVDQMKLDIATQLANINTKTKENIEKTFLALIQSVKNNKGINEKLKNKIVEQINNTFNRYNNSQEEFLEEEIQLFFNNCLGYINYLNPENENFSSKYNDLMLELLNKSKDFFIEYDSKNMKEIFDFILESTSIDSSELKLIANNCAEVFKYANAEKLKSIYTSLNNFKNHINDTFINNRVTDNLFENILIKNPQLLLNQNNIDEVLGLLTGKIAFKCYGYTGEEVILNKEFLSYEFYKKILDDDCSLLFNGGLSNLSANLNYLQDVCKNASINLKYLNINETMLYLLLNNNLYESSASIFNNLVNVINSENLKLLLENNPQLLTLKQSHLNVIVKRCLLNFNSSYNFYDLLFSELYRYNPNEYADLKNAETREFRYYDIGALTKDLHFDIEDILTSGIVEGINLSTLEKAYKQRVKNIDKLNESLDELSQSENQYHLLIKRTLNGYRDLYGNVPDLEVKNKLFVILDSRKNNTEQIYSDLEESLSEKQQLIRVYEQELNDWLVIDETLSTLVPQLSSKKAKNDIKSLLKQTQEVRMTENKKKIDSESKKIEEINQALRELDKEMGRFNLALCQVDFLDDEDIDRTYIQKQSFTIHDLLSAKLDEEVSEEISLDSNVVVFSDNVVLDTKEFLNDKDCVDKLYKFLVDPTFSLKSIEYMSDSLQNADGVEKYRDQREKMWSRRESRTPVRVYYIPVHTKYFTVYYVINVEKESVHQNGGISDSVYKKHVLTCDKILKKINSMDEKEALEYIENAEKEYQEKIEDKYNLKLILK